MKCIECKYAVDYIDENDVVKKQCVITDEVHAAETDCLCEAQRRMYDKRTRLVSEFETIKEQAATATACIICGKTIDSSYGYNRVCYMCKNAIQFITDKRDILDSIVANYEHGSEEASLGENV